MITCLPCSSMWKRAGRSEQITIIRGFCHRSQTQELHYGKAVFAAIECWSTMLIPGNLVFVGRTSRGNNVYEQESGRSGSGDRGRRHPPRHVGLWRGRKSILPGVAGRQTVEFNHLNALHPTEMAINPAIGSNKLEGNPIHEDMVEAAALVNPDFLVNVVLDRHNEIVDFFTGHWLDAWLEGCRLVNEIYGVEVEESDLVIVAGRLPIRHLSLSSQQDLLQCGAGDQTRRNHDHPGPGGRWARFQRLFRLV